MRILIIATSSHSERGNRFYSYILSQMEYANGYLLVRLIWDIWLRKVQTTTNSIRGRPVIIRVNPAIGSGPRCPKVGSHLFLVQLTVYCPLTVRA